MQGRKSKKSAETENETGKKQERSLSYHTTFEKQKKGASDFREWCGTITQGIYPVTGARCSAWCVLPMRAACCVLWICGGARGEGFKFGFLEKAKKGRKK